MYSTKISSNCYITGMFSPKKEGADGSGFEIDAKVKTSIFKTKKTRIYINKKILDQRAITSIKVLELFLKKTNLSSNYLIKHEINIPISCGFSTSAAGALSLSYALNNLWGDLLTKKEIIKIAHDAEIMAKTGMSGVDAISIGGAIVGFKQKIKKIKKENKKNVIIHVKNKIKTDTLFNEKKIQKFSEIGDECIGFLFKNPTIDNFLSQSNKFAINTKLAKEFLTKQQYEILLENKNFAMNMIGGAIFTICDDSQMINNINIIKEKIDGGQIFNKKIIY